MAQQVSHEEFMRQASVSEKQFQQAFYDQEDKFNPITQPEHYTTKGVEPAEFLESLGIAEDFYAGCIIKYVSRYKKKSGVEDVEKAKQYCKMLIDLLQSKSSDANF
jgi:hypothetical protein